MKIDPVYMKIGLLTVVLVVSLIFTAGCAPKTKLTDEALKAQELAERSSAIKRMVIKLTSNLSPAHRSVISECTSTIEEFLSVREAYLVIGKPSDTDIKYLALSYTKAAYAYKQIFDILTKPDYRIWINISSQEQAVLIAFHTEVAAADKSAREVYEDIRSVAKVLEMVDMVSGVWRDVTPLLKGIL